MGQKDIFLAHFFFLEQQNRLILKFLNLLGVAVTQAQLAKRFFPKKTRQLSPDFRNSVRGNSVKGGIPSAELLRGAPIQRRHLTEEVRARSHRYLKSTWSDKPANTRVRAPQNEPRARRETACRRSKGETLKEA